MSQATQNAMILAHLEKGKSITFLEALNKFGVMHLPRRILDLKEIGHNIGDQWVKTNGKRFKKYYLVEG